MEGKVDFTPEQFNIQSILNAKKHLLVPRFQREYCWDDHVTTEFFNDIVSRLEFSDAGKRPKRSPYFMGTLLFLGTMHGTDDGNDNKQLEIVDGQQRMTTITILLSALAARMHDMNPHLSDKVFEYVSDTDDDGNPFPVLTTKTSYPFFQNYVQAPVARREALISDPESEEDECIKKAYDNFSRLLSETNLKKNICRIKGLDESALDSYEDLEILKAIRDEVLQSQVVLITTKDRQDANMIFEILNGKGVHLASVDLIKNRLFEKLPVDSAADKAEELWGKAKAELVSRQNSGNFGTFYRHYWLSKYKKVKFDDLYDSFGKIGPKNKDDCLAFLKELVIEAHLYTVIMNPQKGDFGNRKEYYPLVEYIRHLDEWFGVTQARIAMLALLDVKERGLISGKDLLSCVQMMELFHFAYNSVCHMQSNKFEPQYSKFAIELREKKNKSDTKQVLNGLREKLRRWLPDEAAFIGSFCELTYTKKNSNSNKIMAAKYAINKIAAVKQNHDTFLDDLSVEHLIPESSSSEARLSIGNLIALEGTINKDLGDAALPEKLSTYQKSHYEWMKEFLSKHKTFGDDDVRRRAEEMGKYMYNEVIRPAFGQAD
ncbi:DUF262 domain-containing protein [Bifidobacterium moukalabense]|uniref:DUF262 domain-containing protein n=1 Tax=Bifidobacterium moukalabense TaxID=1333651 RepID=UPI0010F9EB83|nr:DUF262 domain-containing protein [Bifidobacterium moukalabense]